MEWEGKYKALYERELAETAALLAGAGRKPITFEQWLRLHKYETKARGQRSRYEQQCAQNAEPGCAALLLPPPASSFLLSPTRRDAKRRRAAC